LYYIVGQMNYRKRCIPLLFLVLTELTFFSCHDKPGRRIEKDTVKNPAQMDEHVGEDLKKMLHSATESQGKLNDSTYLNFTTLLDSFYAQNDYTPVWSDKEHWLSPGDSLFSFIERGKTYGLFPSDYHYESLAFIRRIFMEDTLSHKNATIWARADIMLSDAFLTLVKHLKQGRFKYDSVTLRKDTVLPDSLYTQTLSNALQSKDITSTLEALEPKHKGYDSLKAYIRNFLAIAHFRRLTWLDYPYTDSVAFFHSLTRRLQEVGYIDSTVSAVDTATLSHAIRNYQHANGLKQTGKPTEDMVNMMDNSDWEKFKRIAINMDRYKLLPDTLPTTYVWVNLPSFYLQVINADTVVLESRVIVGAPKTRTPLLTSEISNFITLPQWTVPTSIIFKEMLPKIKENVNFLAKQNLMVVDGNDSVRDPLKIKWARLNKNNFPYQLKQKQGDDNSLGVMKFNFRNKYDVYLHDTNVRWMFDKTFRAISHGCVRVKQWQKLADFLVRNDSVRYNPDTIRAWIDRKEKHTVYGFARVPIFIRYFTCEGKKGKIIFHDDIYGEDKVLRNAYFANKPIY
jgi:L,D-transpeptidase YcbB